MASIENIAGEAGQEIKDGVRKGREYSAKFQGAVVDTLNNLKKGIFGETYWRRTERGWSVWKGSPGLADIGQFTFRGGQRLSCRI